MSLETGASLDLGDFAAMPVVINVWASWCPGCNDEAGDLRRFAERHPDVGVLGIDVQDTLAGARDFYARWNERHRVVARIIGAGTLADFERGLELATEP